MCSEHVCRRDVAFEVLTRIPLRLTFLSNICHSLVRVSLLLPLDSFFFSSFFNPLTFLWFVCSSVLTLYRCVSARVCLTVPSVPFRLPPSRPFFVHPYTPLSPPENLCKMDFPILSISISIFSPQLLG